MLENSSRPGLLQRLRVLLRNNASGNCLYVRHVLLLKEFHDPRNDLNMGARKNRQPDKLYVFLQGSVDDHLRGLSQTSIDYFHARVAEIRHGNLRPAVLNRQIGASRERSNRRFS